MTKLPHENWDVRVRNDLPKYKVGPKCAHPQCGRYADHAHHIWRRSFTGTPGAWVELWNGKTIGNLAGLCWQHHDLITENRAWIQYLEAENVFVWNDDVAGVWRPIGLLDPMPPLDALPGTRTPTPSADGQGVEREVCPSCGTAKRARAALPPGERRPRKTWSVSVPADHREDGADVLDSLLLGIAEALGRDGHTSWKYFTLVEALVFVTQNLHTLKEDAHAA